VNLGSRLEGLTKYYGVRLIVSETTAEGLGDILLRCLDRVKVKGKNEPVTIYEPVGLSGSVSAELADEVEQSNRALEHYFAGRLDAAETSFQALNESIPERKFYALYLERIATLQSEGIGEDWDGVFAHTTK
jgi:adenylate cyclase